MQINPIPQKPAGDRAEPAKSAHPRPEPSPRPHRTACVSLPPQPRLHRPPPRPSRCLPQPLRPRLPPSPRPPDSQPRDSSSGGGRLRPSLRAQSPAAPGTASYSPDIRNTSPPGLPGACLPPPRRSVTALCNRGRPTSDLGRGGAGLWRDEGRSGAGPIWPRLLPYGEQGERDVAAPRLWSGTSILQYRGEPRQSDRCFKSDCFPRRTGKLEVATHG